MAYIMAETCSCILYIATNCNIIVFMTVCIYRYINTTALYLNWGRPGLDTQVRGVEM